MELDGKKEEYKSGLSGEEVNDLLVEQLFVGESIRNVAVTNPEDTKTKFTLGYVPLNSGEAADLMPYYRHKGDTEMVKKAKQLVESAKMLRSINNKPLIERFKPELYLNFIGDEVVRKKALKNQTFVDRDLSTEPLSDFEKRYLILRGMDPVAFELFYTDMVADCYKVLGTIFDMEEKKKKEKKPLRKEEGKNDPLQ